MSETQVEENFRLLFSRLAADEQLGSPLIRACIRQAKARFSLFRPRANRLAEIAVVSTDTYMTLPSDFLRCRIDDLTFALTGCYPNTRGFFSISNFSSDRVENISLFGDMNLDTTTGISRFKPYIVTPGFKPTMARISTDDNGNWIIQFNDAFGYNKTVKFYYSAFHTIEDATEGEDPQPAKNSINWIFREQFLQVVRGYALQALATEMVVEDEKKAIVYDKLADKAFMALNDITSAGKGS